GHHLILEVVDSMRDVAQMEHELLFLGAGFVLFYRHLGTAVQRPCSWWRPSGHCSGGGHGGVGRVCCGASSASYLHRGAYRGAWSKHICESVQESHSSTPF